MYIYRVETASTHYAVRVEWDGFTVPQTNAELILFAQGAASMRHGGPVGAGAVHWYRSGSCQAEVWVNVA